MPQGRVNPAVFGVALLHNARRRRFGSCSLCHADGRVAGGIYREPRCPPPLRRAARLRRRRLLPPSPFPRVGRIHRPGSAATERSVHRPRRRVSRALGWQAPPKMVSVSLRLKATPSRIARTMCARVWSAAKPIRAARASGSRCGVRSPMRYGAQSTPPEPGGTVAASAFSRSYRLSVMGSGAAGGHSKVIAKPT